MIKTKGFEHRLNDVGHVMACRRHRVGLFQLFFVVCLAILGCRREVTDAPSNTEPDIFVANPIYDFGTVTQDKYLSKSFQLTNRGSVPIQFGSSRTSCTCVDLQHDGTYDQPLYPGNSINIRLGFTHRGITDSEAGTGEIIYRYENATQYRRLRLRVRGSIAADYTLTMPEISTKTLTEDATQSDWHLVSIVPFDENSGIRIENVESSQAGVVVRNVNDTSAEVRFTESTRGRSIRRRIPILIHTTSKRQPRAVVYLTTNFQPLVQVQPRVVGIPANQLAEYTDEITILSVLPTQIVTLTSSSPDISLPNQASLVGIERVKHIVKYAVAHSSTELDGSIVAAVQSVDGSIKNIEIPIHRFK